MDTQQILLELSELLRQYYNGSFSKMVCEYIRTTGMPSQDVEGKYSSEGKTTLFMKLLLLIGLCAICFSCQTNTKQAEPLYVKGLAEAKKITFPIDEDTYYHSRYMFQFEEGKNELLVFQNTEKGTHKIIVFDISNQKVFKEIPIRREGPNGISRLNGCYPFFDSQTFLLFQNSVNKTSVYTDQGEILKNYSIRHSDKTFTTNIITSNLYHPCFIKDSILYLANDDIHQRMKKGDWQRSHLFRAQDLRTEELWKLPFVYPSVFNMEVKNPSGGYEYSYDFNHKDNVLVCSFCGYDSIMVTDDMKNARWYNGKSRYLKTLHPVVGESADGFEWIGKQKQSGEYWHFMYDKYRDVYYRLVEHPCELGPGEYPMDEPKAREFSVIIFDKDFNIIGETKFPGNKYFYKMSFVGRDGLYISGNNLANPDFDENKLVFACFKLEDLKKNN